MQWIACHDCDLLQRKIPIEIGAVARCTRCGAELYRQKRDSLEHTLMFTLAGLIFFILANVYPFMTFELEGREQQNTLATGVKELYENGMLGLSILVFLTSIAFPLLKLSGMAWLLLPLRQGRRPWKLAPVFRMVQTLHPWSMMEVYMLGVLVAYVKLSDLATIVPGIALYFVRHAHPPHRGGGRLLGPGRCVGASGNPDMKPACKTAKSAALIGCHLCGQLSRRHRLPPGGQARCPRCGAALHLRKPNSLARTWALVITACIFYIPANTLPVMTVLSFGKGKPDTILSGVLSLMEANMWILAAVVFFASFAVPILKLAGLCYLLISVQRRSRWKPRERTRLFRIVEAVGRWSMIDVFMVSILIALVKLGSLATIEPGAGATFFASVVVITMFASMSFDPRLIWDATTEDHR